MGRGARIRLKQRRDAEKARRRSSNRAKYASHIGTAANKKRKTLAEEGGTAGKHEHSTRNCGNVGCSECYPVINLPTAERRQVVPYLKGF